MSENKNEQFIVGIVSTACMSQEPKCIFMISMQWQFYVHRNKFLVLSSFTIVESLASRESHSELGSVAIFTRSRAVFIARQLMLILILWLDKYTDQIANSTQTFNKPSVMQTLKQSEVEPFLFSR